MSFAALGLSPGLCDTLTRAGFTQPTPIQTQAIPVVMGGRDLLARAQTGTGKTAAFGLPMIERLARPRAGAPRGLRPRALVLVPTRELALQVHTALASFGAAAKLQMVAIYGGVPLRGQTRALQRGTDIIVATPGRLLDHLQQRAIDLSGIEMLVLDEADRMLDMGFRPALRRVFEALPTARQTLLFSATLSSEVVQLSAAFTRDALRIDVADREVVAHTVVHRVHPVADNRKAELLRHVLTQPPVGQALVFCRTKRGSNRVGEYLEDAGVKTAVIHGNKSQNARTRALGDFKAGRVAVLVATDIAARGIDVAQLPLVVNYDLPLVAADYVHRVGRTGRAGAAGRALSLVSSADRGLLRDIQRLLPEPLEQVPVDGFEAPAATHAAAVPTGFDRRRPAPRRSPGGAPASHARPAARRFGGNHPRAQGRPSRHQRDAF